MALAKQVAGRCTRALSPPEKPGRTRCAAMAAADAGQNLLTEIKEKLQELAREAGEVSDITESSDVEVWKDKVKLAAKNVVGETQTILAQVKDPRDVDTEILRDLDKKCEKYEGMLATRAETISKTEKELKAAATQRDIAL